VQAEGEGFPARAFAGVPHLNVSDKGEKTR
jgi:hypothetical protein